MLASLGSPKYDRQTFYSNLISMDESWNSAAMRLWCGLKQQ